MLKVFSRFGRALVRRGELMRLTRAHLPLLVLLAVTLWMVAPFVWSPPVSHDHNVHLFKAWHYWHEMLGRFRLRGFSFYSAFGFPSEELVPPGSSIWIALFRIATLGQLSWHATYGLSFAALLTFSAWSSFAFTRRFFGAGAGMLAGIFTLMDPGWHSQGGWFWHTYWGVWPVTLGSALALQALGSMHDMLERKGERDWLWTALWTALSLLGHQLPIVIFPLAVPLLLIDAWIRQGKLVLPAALRVLAACALGAALPAFYLLPMLARAEWSFDLGFRGIPLAELGKRVIEVQHLFENVWVPVIVLGPIGGLMALRKRRAGAFFFSAAALSCLVISTDAMFALAHAERLLPSIIKLESARMMLVAKLFWFPLAGFACAEAVAAAVPARREGSGRRLLGLGFCALLIAPFAAPAYKTFAAAQLEKHWETEKNSGSWPAFREFAEWARARRAESREFYRIAYSMSNDIPLVSPVLTDTIAYRPGFTPAQVYQNLPFSSEPELLRAMSVKYLLSESVMPEDQFRLLRQFGGLFLYSLNDFRPEIYTLEGSGKVELLEFEPERIRLKLSAVGPQSSLKLHVANFERWTAELNGKPLGIAPAPALGAHEYPFLMEVPVENGELIFRYVRRGVDWLGIIVSMLAALGIAAWHRSARRGEPVLKLPPLRVPYPRAFLAVAAACLLGACALRYNSRHQLLPKTSLFQTLPGSAVTVDDTPCQSHEELSFVCGSQTLRAAAVDGQAGMHLCMTAPGAHKVSLELPTELGSFLEARYESAPSSEPGSVRVAVDGKELGLVPARPRDQWIQKVLFDTRGYQKKPSSRLSAEFTGRTLACFDLRLLR